MPEFDIDRSIKALVGACAWVSIITTAAIVSVLASESISLLRVVPAPRFLTDPTWAPQLETPHYGLWPLLCGTFLTTGIALLIAVPVGLLSAIYLAEFASDRARRVLCAATHGMATIPTIVWGYMALVLVTPNLQRWIPGVSGYNALAPGLLIGLMIAPIIASIGSDAIVGVPTPLRTSAHALGASRLSTLFRVVLPTAAPAIIGSVLVAMSRAFGETIVVSIAAGHHPRVTLDPRVSVQTMTGYIVQTAHRGSPDGATETNTIFLVGAILLVMTASVHSAARWRFRLARQRSIAK